MEGGLKSTIDWDDVMQNRAVAEVTRMAPANTADPHTPETDQELLEHFHSQIDRVKHILDLSMRDVNARR